MSIELAYINTKHPDFEEAKLIYRGLSDELCDGPDHRKTAIQNAAAAVNKQVRILNLLFASEFSVAFSHSLSHFIVAFKAC